MYVSRPKVTPVAQKQLAKSPSVALHQGKGNETTVMARDNATRHPVTKQWLSRYQNQQSEADAVPVITRKGE